MTEQCNGIFTENSCPTKPLFDVSVFAADASARANHPAVSRFHETTLPQAQSIVRTGLERYGTNKAAIAFNGGKDCTVALHLVLAEIEKSYRSESPIQIPVVYFRSRPQFIELEEFIQDKIRLLGLSLTIYEGDIKDALFRFKSDFPDVQGIFMGTRCKDPSSRHLSAFSPTDPGWAEFVRILPILNFSYHDVWLYLKEFNIYYCKLYDDGYTSVGWEGNTVRNEKLRRVADDGTVKYLPAYLLEDSDDERVNRE
ncbi:FAD synthase-like [Paramacrobiotus metropolitanus]|uniref:FAD synthase-like n=1 Tax=Paramacrobiotus metropolitanus TaxID=2943436 RepID=UPI0024463A6F|nr:FAD synthase-like [Paramacrobiotus metropolitanus]